MIPLSSIPYLDFRRRASIIWNWKIQSYLIYLEAKELFLPEVLQTIYVTEQESHI
jgi:hypothetical protein